MIDWKRKLCSRKLWMAAAGLVSGLMVFCGAGENAAGQVSALILSAASVLGYLLGEGLADAGGQGGGTE